MNILYTGEIKPSVDTKKYFSSTFENVIYFENERSALDFNPKTIDVVICNNLFVYHNIEQFIVLKFVQFTSAGLDRVPVEYLEHNNIQFNCARGVYSSPIAEFVINRILMVYKSNDYFALMQNRHLWKKNRGLRELTDQTVLIIGYGSVGKAIAKRLYSFDVRISVLDKCKIEDEKITEQYNLNEIREAILKSNIVILCLPLTNETYHLIGIDELSLLSKESIFINVSRGEIVDQKAIIKILNLKKDVTFILDVFEEEPLNKNSPLWDAQNVYISPHNSFVSNKNFDRLNKLTTKNISQFMESFYANNYSIT